MNEASLYDRNVFITLTYDNNNLPRDLSLNHKHFADFMKRLRKKFGAGYDKQIRYYMCGEYGEGRGRPHYHACLFNLDFRDKLYFKRVGDSVLYTSDTLQRLWPFGFSLIGDVTFESAAYVARYCVNKRTGKDADKTYRLIDKETGETFLRKPEYNKASSKPGIGAPWLDKYVSDVYPRGEILVRGHMTKPPRYYDKRFREHHDHNDIIYNQIRQRREQKANLHMADQTRERRAVREQVATARQMSKRKTLL